jgi:hypothetical protein
MLKSTPIVKNTKHHSVAESLELDVLFANLGTQVLHRLLITKIRLSHFTQVVNELIQNYLVHAGYPETAKCFYNHTKGIHF